MIPKQSIFPKLLPHILFFLLNSDTQRPSLLQIQGTEVIICKKNWTFFR